MVASMTWTTTFLTFDVEEDWHSVPSMLILDHKGVGATVPQAHAPHGQSADVAVLHVGVLHQLRLVLAV